MKSYFKVESLASLSDYLQFFELLPLESEKKIEYIDLFDSCGRIIAEDIFAGQDIPGFRRSTMDGFAIKSEDSFGASESSPLLFNIIGSVKMGEKSDFSVNSGEAVRIGTGGMLPHGTDSVVMLEFTESIGDDEVTIFKPAAPGTNTVNKNDDFSGGDKILEKGSKITSKSIGLLAVAGRNIVPVYRKPSIGIISTGDELVSVDQSLSQGQIRDINRYTLTSLAIENGANPYFYGILKDVKELLTEAVLNALNSSDMVIISGGSSVGMRDVTIEAIESIDDSEILFHGVSMSPGKPVILGRVGSKPVFGLPGHPVSCFVVFLMVVNRFLNYIGGQSFVANSRVVYGKSVTNIYSEQGRTDFVRVRLEYKNLEIIAHPILGESGLIRTLGHADGLLEIAASKEGLVKGEMALIHLL